MILVYYASFPLDKSKYLDIICNMTAETLIFKQQREPKMNNILAELTRLYQRLLHYGSSSDQSTCELDPGRNCQGHSTGLLATNRHCDIIFQMTSTGAYPVKKYY